LLRKRSACENIIVNDNFGPLLERSIAILKPIDGLIVKYQSDQVTISEVLPDFHALRAQFSNLQRATVQEINFLQNASKDRLQFMYGKGNGLSYLLDPRFLCEDLPPGNRVELEDQLLECPINDLTPVDDQRREAIYTQYMPYVISAAKEKDINSFRFKMLKKRSKTALQYWMSDGLLWPKLSKICVKVFSMVTSSVASERNFSTMGFIHSQAS
jgi:hypothetical protein